MIENNNVRMLDISREICTYIMLQYIHIILFNYLINHQFIKKVMDQNAKHVMNR
jgi:hypothetical protein